ncbi:MAG: hypothetical protein NZ521_03855 [Flammeovirgaceae bacterium]|nr:hypothetical protein [Flammeovirgaceae bacterium]MDW8287327.1 hypothetical protein [Flammeovirgaceae bacterium]
MKKVVLDEKAAKHLVNFYQNELKTLMKKVEEVKAKIAELGESFEDDEKNKKIKKKTETAKKTKNLRLPWEDFVIDTLRAQNKPMTTSELAEIAVAQYQLTGPNAIKGRNSINRYVGNMCKEEKLKAHAIEGSRAYLYGFPEWFDGNVLKEEWLSKLSMTK